MTTTCRQMKKFFILEKNSDKQIIIVKIKQQFTQIPKNQIRH